MIPACISADVLPPGIHWTTWADIEARCGTTPYRRSFLARLKRSPFSRGRLSHRLSGQFCDKQTLPNDYGLICEWDGVAMTQDDPILLDLFKERDLQKAVYGREFLR